VFQYRYTFNRTTVECKLLEGAIKATIKAYL